MFLTKEQIFAAMDLKRETVEIPEWSVDGVPGQVIVQELTARERENFENSIEKEDGTKDYSDFHARAVAMTCVTETGEKLFSDADVEMLAQKSLAVLLRIADVAARISKLRPDDVEEARKNLSEGQSEDSNLG